MNATEREASPLPVLDQPLRLRMRPDLIVRQQSYRGRARWIVKDPLAGTFFQFAEEEFSLLQMLDGRTSLRNIRDEFARRFAPKQINIRRLQAWLGTLHRDGLLLTEASGTGFLLLQRRQRQRSADISRQLLHFIAIRFRGVDPDRFLTKLYAATHWLFAKPMVILSLLIMLLAAFTVLFHWDQVHERLPSLRSMLQGPNLLYLVLALAGTKVLHELGHGLACKHFGGECHELGLMLLVFTPCLYCDVSDAWLVRSRWHRIAIAAAGMYFELLLATLCAFVWWFSRPGLLHVISLNVMLVSGVATILFNANPLLRYDGYFILSDFVEMPNLWTRSRAALSQMLSKFFTEQRATVPDSLDDQPQTRLVTYAILSSIYHGLLLLAIGGLLLTVLRPYRLQLVGQLLVLLLVVGVVLQPMLTAWHRLRDVSRRAKLRRGRVAATLLGVLVAILFLAFVPLPYRVSAPVLLEPHGAQRAYVTVPGQLVESVAVGEKVLAGEPLATLENLDLRREVVQLSGEHRSAAARLGSLHALRGDDARLASRIPEVEETLADTFNRWQQRTTDVERLVIKSTRSGVVLSGPTVHDEDHDRHELPPWSGTPLDSWNRGAYLPAGTLVCLVGDPFAWDAVAVVRGAEIRFVKPGQRVRVKLHHARNTTLLGTVAEIAKIDLASLPPELLGEVATQGTSGSPTDLRPIDSMYQVRILLPPTELPLVDRTRGQARLIVEPQSLGRRVWRYLSRTFTFELNM